MISYDIVDYEGTRCWRPVRCSTSTPDIVAWLMLGHLPALYRINVRLK